MRVQMTGSLPPDLSRLGDQLAVATAHSAASERRGRLRRRIAAAGAVTALAFVLLAPASLQPRDGTRLNLAATAGIGYTPTACDRPRGATFAAARPCASPGTTDVEPGRLARRLAVQ